MAHDNLNRASDGWVQHAIGGLRTQLDFYAKFMPILSALELCSLLSIRYAKSVNIVLLPVQGGVGLDDDVLMGVLFQFVDEHGLASL